MLSSHISLPTARSTILGLPYLKTAYTKSVTIDFGDINAEAGGIQIPFDEKKRCVPRFIVPTRMNFDGLQILKYKRALRIAQDVGQQMSRIGFDEFEPFREKRSLTPLLRRLIRNHYALVSDFDISIACRLMNSGGKAFPIINATLPRPSVRSNR